MADEFAAVARSLECSLRLRAWNVVFNARYRWWLQAVVGIAVAITLAGLLLSTITLFFNPRHLIIHP